MQTTLSDSARQLPRAEEADGILRTCVHCGFCNATCPTYQLLGDELDGPRGRIYLIKQVLEGNEVTQKTQQHLDRCLSCRNCETTCPSGVDYHNLLDIGRAVVDAAVPRPVGQRLLREGLRTLVPHAHLFKGVVSGGQVFRALLPGTLQSKLPRSTAPSKPRPITRHTRQVLMLEGCVQPSLSPNTNVAAARVLDRLGISVTPSREAGCCGAVDYHLDAQAAGLIAPGTTSTPGGRASKKAPRPSCKPPAAAVRLSRTTAICCAATRSMPRRPEPSARWPGT